MQELVDAIPEWFIGEKDEQTVEFAEWLIEQAFVTVVPPVRDWSREQWMGLYGLWFQGTDHQDESDAFWDWIEVKGIDPAKVSNDEGLEKKMRGEFHVVWLAQKTE